MPKVLLDLRMVRGRLHGIARYALELACRLPSLAPDWELEALVPPEGLPGGLGPLAPPVPVHRSLSGFLSPLEQATLPVQLLQLAPDLFHATSFSVPAFWPGPLVATLHDANHLALPENYGARQRAYYRLLVAPRVRRAAAVLTVSDFSRAELSRELELPPERFQVIAPGVDPRYQPPAASEMDRFRRKHALPTRYLAAVGNTKAHKNLRMLASLAERIPVPIALLAGTGAARELGFPPSTRELPDLAEEEMPLLYGAATLLVLPSFYEGFGLPVLEAMACGCPVVAADRSSLPELSGGAAALVAPDDPAGWLDAILRLLRNEPERRRLRTLGLERAARFSWDTCARQTLAAYQRALC